MGDYKSSKGRKNRLLSHAETIELIKKAQKGDRVASEKLVEYNLELVRSIVKKFQNRGYERDDLFQLGSIGLVKAIQNFDTSFEVKVSTYAVPMIMGEIKRYLRDDGIIKVSRSLKELVNKVVSVKEQLKMKLGREPGIQEIAEAIGSTPEDIVYAMEATKMPVSIYDVI